MATAMQRSPSTAAAPLYASAIPGMTADPAPTRARHGLPTASRRELITVPIRASFAPVVGGVVRDALTPSRTSDTGTLARRHGIALE